MADYKKMYLTLLNATANAIGALQEAHKAAEEIYMNSGNIVVELDETGALLIPAGTDV